MCKRERQAKEQATQNRRIINTGTPNLLSVSLANGNRETLVSPGTTRNGSLSTNVGERESSWLVTAGATLAAAEASFFVCFFTGPAGTAGSADAVALSEDLSKR